MAQLLHLDGRPQSWPELLERNRTYWEAHDLDGELKPVRQSYFCTQCIDKIHHLCTRDRSGKSRRVVCACPCERATSRRDLYPELVG